MRNLVLSMAASAAMLAAAPLANAQAASDGRLIFGVESVGAPQPVQDVQFLFGGRNYCWYPVGWRGPGYYWCGYANQRGLGWGGPVGWHGWRSGGPGDRGDRGNHAVPRIAMAHGGPVGGRGGPPAAGHGDAPGGGQHGGGHGGGGHSGGDDHHEGGH